MKKFTIVLFGVIFITLIASTIQSTSADQHIPIKEILASGVTELVSTRDSTIDSNFQIYLQLIIRNVDGNLINVTESTADGAFIDHMISDHVFDTLMEEKEIITINDIKYERAQWSFNPTLEHRFVGLYPIYSEITLNLVSKPGDDTVLMYTEQKDYSQWKMHYCADFKGFGFTCVPVFQVLVPTMTMEPTDTVEQKWTILRDLN